MKHGAWAWSRIEPAVFKVLWLITWVGGTAACLAIAWLFVWAEPPHGTYTRLETIERWTEPLAELNFTQAGFAQLARRELDLRPAQWEEVTLPDVRPLPMQSDQRPGDPKSQAWFRLRYRVPADITKEVPLAVYGTRVKGGGAYTVWVDGKLLWLNLEDWRMQWNHPLFVTLPLSLSHPGAVVEVLLAFPYREAQGYALGSLYIGPAYTLRFSRDQREFFQRTMPFIATLVGVLMGLLSLPFWLVRRAEKAHGVMAVTSVAWLICNLQFIYEFSENDMASQWYGQIMDLSIAWMLMLIFMFAFRLGDRRYPRVEAALAAHALISTLCTLPIWDWQMSALLLQEWIMVAVGVLTASLMTWDAYKGKRVEIAVLGVSVWLLILSGIHDLVYMTSQTYPDQVWIFPFGTIFVFLAFIFATQRQYVGALTLVENANMNLAEKLTAREQELRITHEELMAVEQRQTLLLERQRLARDVHDGIGASLMTSLAWVEGKDIDPEHVAQMLRECLDDLRIVIESLEPMEHDLTTLLGTLRHRFGHRLEAAGLTLDWQMDELPLLPWLDSPQALHILRIVQEALSNIVKHANAHAIAISARQIKDGQGRPLIAICIADDGEGFDTTQRSSGRGLKHMKERAQAVGGILHMTSSAGQGSRLELLLPVLTD